MAFPAVICDVQIAEDGNEESLLDADSVGEQALHNGNDSAADNGRA